MKIEEKEINGYKLIEIDNGELKITLSNLGASIYSIIFNNEEMLLTPKDINLFLSDNYYGKLTGRITNRIGDGLLLIDNKNYYLPLNEGDNTLHCGDEGLNKLVFDYTINSTNLETVIKFSLISKELGQSLPGDAYIVISYTLKNYDPKIYIDKKVESNKKTIMNLSNYLYFTLGSHGLNDKKIQINASKFIHSKRENLVPLYKVNIPSCLDYLSLKPVLFNIDNIFLQDHASFGLDHCFILDRPSLINPGVIFENNKYRLKAYTNNDGFHICSCNYPDGVEKVSGPSEKYEGLLIAAENEILNKKIDQHFENRVIYHFEKK